MFRMLISHILWQCGADTGHQCGEYWKERRGTHFYKNNIVLREHYSVKDEWFAINVSGSLDATPFLFQLKTVVKRNNLALWRSPDYVFTRLFIHAFISLFVSLSLLQLGTSVRDLQYRVSKLRRDVSCSRWPTIVQVFAMYVWHKVLQARTDFAQFLGQCTSSHSHGQHRAVVHL